jgi:hypothetical protein
VFLATAKLPLVVALPTFSADVPVLVNVVVTALLVLLTASFPKFNEPGERVAEVVTDSIGGVVCARVPEVPVTIAFDTPVAAVPLAASVSVVVLAAGFGLKVAVIPFGKLDAEKDTLPLNPFQGVIEIVLVTCPPSSTSKVFGAADSV